MTEATTTLKQQDKKYSETVIQMMRSQAYRELAAAQMFGHGLQFVPDIKSLKFMAWHIQEETEHYIAVAQLYQQHTGESVEPWVKERLQEKPIPFSSSWLELGVAQWLYDRGGFWQLQEYENCSWEPYRTIIGKIIKEERGHQSLGARIAVQLCQDAENRAEAQKIFAKWLRQGLLSFGRPHNEGNRYAIEVGLKKRDSAEVMKDFIDDIREDVKATGLEWPSREELGVELPEDIDWSL
ncbi:MAG: phenylacetate-CoA oxygenase subunit PaaI [Blastocatellia bacterium]|nr:phenylacetate-CoA oxygenase subunit PaaI [Blastocatellia bacterium]